MQCKDIPDLPVLAFMDGWDNQPVTWFSGVAGSVLYGMPRGTPPKLALAKMRMLLRRRLVEGCGCGCRGDFKLTDKGRRFLSKGKGEKVSFLRKPNEYSLLHTATFLTPNPHWNLYIGDRGEQSGDNIPNQMHVRLTRTTESWGDELPVNLGGSLLLRLFPDTDLHALASGVYQGGPAEPLIDAILESPHVSKVFKALLEEAMTPGKGA